MLRRGTGKRGGTRSESSRLQIPKVASIELAVSGTFHWVVIPKLIQNYSNFNSLHIMIQSDPDLTAPDLAAPRFNGRINFPQKFLEIFRFLNFLICHDM